MLTFPASSMPWELAKTCTAIAGRMKTLAPKLVFLGPYRSRNQVQDMAPKAIASWVMEPHKEIHFDLKMGRGVSLGSSQYRLDLCLLNGKAMSDRVEASKVEQECRPEWRRVEDEQF